MRIRFLVALHFTRNDESSGYRFTRDDGSGRWGCRSSSPNLTSYFESRRVRNLSGIRRIRFLAALRFTRNDIGGKCTTRSDMWFISHHSKISIEG
ncbi:MAG: hypothetical protein AAGF85_11505 [Bacteroidota bacterium]